MFEQVNAALEAARDDYCLPDLAVTSAGRRAGMIDALMNLVTEPVSGELGHEQVEAVRALATSCGPAAGVADAGWSLRSRPSLRAWSQGSGVRPLPCSAAISGSNAPLSTASHSPTPRSRWCSATPQRARRGRQPAPSCPEARAQSCLRPSSGRRSTTRGRRVR